MKKSILALAAAGMMLTSCTGPFNATKHVYNWQTSFEDKWGDELAFLGCAILPVYGLTMLGDAIIFNSFEFWGEENPISSVALDNHGEKANVVHLENGNIQIETEAGRILILEKSADGVVARSESGDLLYKSEKVNDTVIVSDADGKVIDTYNKM